MRARSPRHLNNNGRGFSMTMKVTNGWEDATIHWVNALILTKLAMRPTDASSSALYAAMHEAYYVAPAGRT